MVTELVLRARDPLAPLESMCRDALKAAADLERLLEKDDWQRVDEVCPHVRANAVLHLCDEVLSCPVSASPATERCGVVRRGGLRSRIKKCQAIRTRVKVAADEELVTEIEVIEQIVKMQEARCPDRWEVLRGLWDETLP